MGSVREALMLVGQLRHRAESHYAAELAGGPQHIGWDSATYMQADTRVPQANGEAAQTGNGQRDQQPAPHAPIGG